MAYLIQFRTQAQVLGQALPLARGVPKITRTVARMVLTVTYTSFLAAFTVGDRDDPWAKIAKGLQLLVQQIPLIFESF
jgi:hypothetical protein